LVFDFFFFLFFHFSFSKTFIFSEISSLKNSKFDSISNLYCSNNVLFGLIIKYKIIPNGVKITIDKIDKMCKYNLSVLFVISFITQIKIEIHITKKYKTAKIITFFSVITSIK